MVTFCLLSSPLHTRSAGSGVQVPTADIPFGDTQVAFILPAGTYRGLHLKNIWAPPTVPTLWMFSTKPFPGAGGIPQLTGGRKLIVYNSLISSTEAKSATEVKIHIAQTTHPFYPSRSLSDTTHAEFSDPMM